MKRYDITLPELGFLGVTMGAVLALAYFEWMQ